MNNKIIIESNVAVDNYTEYVCDKYDLQTRDKIISEIPMIDTSELERF